MRSCLNFCEKEKKPDRKKYAIVLSLHYHQAAAVKSSTLFAVLLNLKPSIITESLFATDFGNRRMRIKERG